MCTAATYLTKDHYFGRTLDYEVSYGEEIVVTPRNCSFRFRHMTVPERHYAIIGMATVANGIPLYYDATNEKGLSMAGLNFPGNAFYGEPVDGKDNVAVFELIPWLLGWCATVREVREKLKTIEIVNTPFSPQFPTSPLHWIIADRDEAITLEAVKEGIRVYDNPVGILTNNPPFDYQMFNLNNYMALSSEPAENHFSEKLQLEAYSRGMGMLGMPGDLSSASRFVRAAYTKMNSCSGEDESASISQFFHILGSVAQPRGSVHMGEGKYEITIYTSCCNTDKGIYYYTTYENSQISAVDLHRENLEGTAICRYPLTQGQHINMQN